MNNTKQFNTSFFSENGLNLYTIFDIRDLAKDLKPEGSEDYEQLILLAHGGKRMWEVLKEHEFKTDDPVDEFSKSLVNAYFKDQLPNHKFSIVYPSDQIIGLRRLGERAGWHHDSPFRIGINHQWGSWFAYRVAVLADTHFETTVVMTGDSPCNECTAKPCLAACPAGALNSGSLVLEDCIEFRKSEHSVCANTCLSRLSCPIASQHRYSEEQINYHYGISLETIKKYY